jgi:hypothetical protein
MWTQDSGIQPFPGGGLSYIQPIGDERYIIYLNYTAHICIDHMCSCMQPSTIDVVNAMFSRLLLF